MRKLLQGKHWLLPSLFFGSVLLITNSADAHQSGCHRWHSCPSDTGSYICGDLGYPCIYPTYTQYTYTPAPAEELNAVIAVARRNFKLVFGRAPNQDELSYWGIRYRFSPGMQNDAVFQQEMRDFLELGYSYGDYAADGYKEPGKVKKELLAEKDKIADKEVPAITEIMFNEVFNRRISSKESTYWKHRARTDKKLKSQLKGAMFFSKAKGMTMPSQSKLSVIEK